MSRKSFMALSAATGSGVIAVQYEGEEEATSDDPTKIKFQTQSSEGRC